MSELNLLKNYQDLNNSFKKELIFYVGLSSGFFSEYNNMIISMLYCLEHKIKFKLCSDQANFDEKNGWNGFFLPFCEEVISDKTLHWRSRSFVGSVLAYFTKKDTYKRRNENLLLYFKPIPRKALTQHVFGRSRNKLIYRFKRYEIKELGIDGDFQQACKQLIKITWKFNDLTQMEISAMISSINMPENYVAFHIRRGDKNVEHEFEPIEKYFTKLGEYIAIKNVFILTDDYRVIEQVKQDYPNWNVYTLCETNKIGYFQGQVNEFTYLQKRDYILRLIASIEIINNAKQFICVFSSNPDMFLGMRNPEICRGVDYDKWILW